MPRKRQRRAHMIALGGVVVDDVEHHLDAGIVQPRHRGAEGIQRVVLRVARLRREEGERVVAPVVAQFLLDEHAVVDQGHGSAATRSEVTPSRFEMVDHRRRRQSAIGAAQIGRRRRRASASGP